jgi:hypothetical protein
MNEIKYWVLRGVMKSAPGSRSSGSEGRRRTHSSNREKAFLANLSK